MSPLDVLYKAMVRYETQIPLMLHKIYELIKAEQPAIAAKIALALEKSQDKAIDAAAKLAPYKSARLQSIEVNAKVTKRYVVRSPSIISNTQTWLDKVSQEQKALPKPNLTPNGHDSEIPEDVDFIDINAES